MYTISDLIEMLSHYIWDEKNKYLFDSRNADKHVYINPTDRVEGAFKTVLYCIEQEYPRFDHLVFLWEDDTFKIDDAYSMIDLAETQTQLIEIVTLDTLRLLANDFERCNIFFKVPKRITEPRTNRLVTLTLKDITSSETLREGLNKKLAGLLPIEALASVSAMAPMYLYIEDIREHQQYRQVLNRLSQWNIETILVFDQQIVEDKVVHDYAHLIEQNKSWLSKLICDQLNRDCKPLLNAMTMPRDNPAFNPLSELFYYLVNRKVDCYIVTESDLPMCVIRVFALVNCGSGKRFLFTNLGYETMFKDNVFRILNNRDLPLYYQIGDLHSLYWDGSLRLYRCNNAVLPVYVKELNMNLKYTVWDTSELFSFLSVTEDGVVIAATSEDTIVADTKTERDIRYNQVDYEGTAEQYEFIDPVQFIYDELMKQTGDLEQAVYVVLRFIEQLLHYKTIYTVQDLIAIRDTFYNCVYLGVGSCAPKCKIDLIDCRIYNYVKPNIEIDPCFVNFNFVDDWERFEDLVVSAYVHTNDLAGYTDTQTRLEIPNLDLDLIASDVFFTAQNQELFELYLYSFICSEEVEKKLYKNLGWSPVMQIWAMTMEPCVTNMRKYLLPYMSTVVSPYGLHGLSKEASPITIGGSLNFTSNRVEVYMEAFRKLLRK